MLHNAHVIALEWRAIELIKRLGYDCTGAKIALAGGNDRAATLTMRRFLDYRARAGRIVRKSASARLAEKLKKVV